MKNNIICIFLFIIISVVTIFSISKQVYALEDIQAKSAVVIEGSTGEIIYNKDKDLKLNPASITKIMTLLLIYEELDAGKLKLTDKVSVSEHAASMGGSQVYLEPGEIQDVETMIKCISIASANDAAVAMAEHIAGAESSFVERMNKKAKLLGMKNTYFKNCCGLDVDGHYSSAYDVAIMSRELICKYPQITKYTTTWMDSFIHKTRKGEKEFGLTNTNKLVRSYNGITGLKTGSTSLAKYCLSATAKRNGINIIVVVMGVPEHKMRYTEAAKLLDYGFSKVHLYEHKVNNKFFNRISVKGGNPNYIEGYTKDNFKYVKINDEKKHITYKIKVLKLNLPIDKHEKIGVIEYFNNKDVLIGKQDIYAKNSCRKITYVDIVYKLVENMLVKININ